MRTAASSLLLLAVLSACGGATPAPTAPEPVPAGRPAPAASQRGALLFDEEAMRAALAVKEKTPYTAAEIRAATRPGRTYTWAVEIADGPPVRRVIRFTAVDDERATFVAETADADGKNPRVDPPEQVTWEELRQHAEFQRVFVAVTEERIEVPAGAYECLVYTVKAATRDGDEEKHTFWFAKELPGPPVKMVVTRGGKLARSQVLTAYAPGG